MAYLLKKNNDKKELFSLPSNEGYTFKPKSSKKYLSVKEVNVLDPNIIEKILTKKFNERFNKLFKMAQYIINDDDASEGDTILALDEVALMRGILLNKYQKFLNEEKEELFLQKLRLVENNLRYKQVMIKKNAIYLQYQQEINNSRGR